MTFANILEQVREPLQNKGRVSYRALKLQFNLDDEYLNGLKDELVEASLVGTDEHTPLRELVPLFAALLSLPLSKDYVPLSLSSQKQKEKTHEALVTWLCGQTKQEKLT